MKKETVEEFLKRGGKIEKLKPGYPKLGVGSLEKSKKPMWSKEEIQKGKDKKRDWEATETIYQKPSNDHLLSNKVPVFIPTPTDDKEVK